MEKNIKDPKPTRKPIKFTCFLNVYDISCFGVENCIEDE